MIIISNATINHGHQLKQLLLLHDRMYSTGDVHVSQTTRGCWSGGGCPVRTEAQRTMRR